MNIAPFSRLMEGIAHDSVAGDRLAKLHHRDFLTMHLLAGTVVLAVLPIWLARFGPLSVEIALTFLWPVLPLALVVYVSRTGRIEFARFASAVAFTVLVVWIAALSGGLDSLVLAGLVFVPLEAVLSGGRRSVMASTAVALLGLTSIIAVDALGIVPEPPPIATTLPLSAALVAGAIGYAGALALRTGHRADVAASAAGADAARYRSLADHTADLITRHAQNGDVAFASPSAKTLIGSDPGEVLGEGLFRRIHVADRPVYLRALSEVYISGHATTVAFRLLRAGNADGGDGFVPVEMRCSPVLDDDGTVSAVVAATRDMSRHRHREGEFEEARAAAESGNLAKTRFLAHVSHEFRTPLNAIIGFAQILEGQGAAAELTGERRHEYARLIHASGKHLLDLMDGLLDMSKVEAGMYSLSPEQVRLAPLIAGSCDMLGEQASGRAVTVVREVPEGLPDISADARACRQILLNLLSNAIKFSDRGGRVVVGARVEGEAIALYVRDTGIGIATDDLARLGTPFVQAGPAGSRQRAGSGLGLSMVKGLVSLHGGRLKIDSTPGAGTTATAYLPIARDDERLSVATSDALLVAPIQEKERRIA